MPTSTVVLGKVKRDDELIKGSSQEGLQKLSEHHPLVIEGMGGYDTRDPRWLPQQFMTNCESIGQNSTLRNLLSS